MKLYYSPGACSMACHIVMNELGMAFETELVNLKDKTCQSGDYTKINSKGQVPCLKMDNGEYLSEAAVIIQYLADQKPEMNLMPKHGTNERYRTLEWLNYTATEIHKGLGLVFGLPRVLKDETMQNAFKMNWIEGMTKKFSYVDTHLNGKEWVTGSNFTVADAYLFTCLNWCNFLSIDLSQYKNISAWMGRCSARPAFKKTFEQEGLGKK